MKLLTYFIGILLLVALAGFTFFALLDVPVQQTEIRMEIPMESLTNAS